MKFIWGIKSADDVFVNTKCSLLTMNDIDVLYDNEKNKFMISIETIYKMSLLEQKQYIQRLYNQFKQHFIISNKYIYDCQNVNFDDLGYTEADTLDELSDIFSQKVNRFLEV